jgi:hypothetical protein
MEVRYEVTGEVYVISPDELIDEVMVVPLINGSQRYETFKRLAEENGFADKIKKSENYEHDGLELFKAKELKTTANVAAVVVVDYNTYCRDYLLFVKDNSAWTMTSVTWVDSSDHASVDIECAPGFDNVWLIYRALVLSGTGYEKYDEVWIDRKGNEALRFACKISDTRNGESKSFTATRSTSRENKAKNSNYNFYWEFAAFLIIDYPKYTMTLDAKLDNARQDIEFSYAVKTMHWLTETICLPKFGAIFENPNT